MESRRYRSMGGESKEKGKTKRSENEFEGKKWRGSDRKRRLSRIQWEISSDHVERVSHSNYHFYEKLPHDCGEIGAQKSKKNSLN